MNVIIVGGFHKKSSKPGGIKSYVINLIKYLEQNNMKTTHIPISKHPTLDSSSSTPYKPDNISNIRFLFRLLLMPGIKNINKGSIIHAQRPDLLFPFILRHKSSLKICTIHGNHYSEMAGKQNFLVTAIYRIIEKYCVKRADKLIFVNENTMNIYLKQYKNISEKSMVVPAGVDFEQFKPMDKIAIREKHNIASESKAILYVGRFGKEKGIKLLLDSYKHVKNEIQDAKLILIGQGPMENSMKKYSKDHSLKDVVFMGFKGYDVIPEHINTADVLALTSHYEGSPTVVREALACGIPVVSTDVGDVSIIIKDGLNGHVIKSRSAKEFSSCLIDALLNMGNNKQKCVDSIERYSWNNVIKEIIEVYHEASN